MVAAAAAPADWFAYERRVLRKRTTSPDKPPALVVLLTAIGLLLLLETAVATNSTYISAPFVNVMPPIIGGGANAKLVLQRAYLTLDPDNGVFYMNESFTYADSNSAPRELNTVFLSGNLFFQSPSFIGFAFNSTNCTGCCRQAAVNSPSMCPFQETMISGPFNFLAHPNDGSDTLTLDITTSSTYVDPNTGKAMNFLGAYIPFSWTCAGTCAPLSDNVLPPAPLPDNGTLDVRDALP